MMPWFYAPIIIMYITVSFESIILVFVYGGFLFYII